VKNPLTLLCQNLAARQAGGGKGEGRRGDDTMQKEKKEKKEKKFPR